MIRPRARRPGAGSSGKAANLPTCAARMLGLPSAGNPARIRRRLRESWAPYLAGRVLERHRDPRRRAGPRRGMRGAPLMVSRSGGWTTGVLFWPPPGATSSWVAEPSAPSALGEAASRIKDCDQRWLAHNGPAPTTAARTASGSRLVVGGLLCLHHDLARLGLRWPLQQRELRAPREQTLLGDHKVPEPEHRRNHVIELPCRPRSREFGPRGLALDRSSRTFERVTDALGPPSARVHEAAGDPERLQVLQCVGDFSSVVPSTS